MEARLINESGWRIIVHEDLYLNLEYLLTSKYHKEFTVFTYCNRVGNTFLLHTPFIPEQTNSAALTEVEGDALVDLMVKESCDLSELKGHMHSHVNMQVFASGTDESEIIDRGREGGFNAAIIMNKRMEIFGHIVDYDTGLYLTKVPVQVGSDEAVQKFDESKLKRVKRAKSMKEVRTLINQTYESYLRNNVKLTKKRMEQLDKEVKDKFKSKTYVYQGAYGGNYYGTGNNASRNYANNPQSQQGNLYGNYYGGSKVTGFVPTEEQFEDEFDYGYD